MNKTTIFLTTLLWGTLVFAGEPTKELTNSVAILWVYQDENEARNLRGKNGLDRGPVDREVVSVWHIPNTIEGRFLRLTVGAYLDKEKARALHVALINKKIELAKDMAKDGLLPKDRSRWQISIYEKLRRETSKHWYNLEVLTVGNNDTLLQIIDQSELKKLID